MNKDKYHVSTKFKYIFTENIDQLYECFFSSEVLNKINPLEYPFELSVENSKTYSLEWKHPTQFHITLQYSERIDEHNYKSITKKLTSINHKKVDSFISLKYSFFVNTTNHSTYLIIDIECEKADEFYKEYDNSIALKSLKAVCNKVKDFLRHWNTSILEMDSIVINRPIFKVWKILCNKEIIHDIFLNKKSNDYSVESEIKKDKVIIRIDHTLNKGINGILLMRISPITTFICFESKGPLRGDKSKLLLKMCREEIEKICSL